MTLALANRKDAIKARLDEAFPANMIGYSYFDVRLNRVRKGHPRTIAVSWLAYPFESDVQAALGDLYVEDVTFERRLLWSCGRLHDDAMDAWKAHEGAHHLEYESDFFGSCGHDLDEKVLTEDTEAELRAAGETFESECRPGNYVTCPTCGGGARYMPDRKTLRFEPCPDCAALGTDRGTFLGILDLDVPAHLAHYQQVIADHKATVDATKARERAKRERALTEPTSTAPANWRRLPTRDAGLLNGIPVATVAPDCDYLTNAEDPERRVLCGNRAQWFDPTTGLRVCTRHKVASSGDYLD